MQVAVRDLSFSYAKHNVLNNVSFTVPEGTLFGLIGPNGCGKTTLLKLLTRVLKPDSGSILLGEKELSRYSQRELARCMAVVTQETDGGYLFTVEEVVTMGRAPYLGRFQSETARDREIVLRALELTGCLKLRHRLVSELSGGERQRVMVARALAQEPKILLLDEPTSHLDIGYQQEILDLVRHLNSAEGVTVVVVLHDLNLAAYYCHKLLLLNGGGVFAQGLPAEVITPENISQVYGTQVLVTPHPVLATPQVLLLPSNSAGQKTNGRTVHVLAGGGSAGDLFRDLKEIGFTVTAGVLNVGDSDWEAAAALSIKVVSEAPFSPISPARHEENLAMVKEADAVILAETPVGHGNRLNLEAAREALRLGKAVFIMEEKPDRNRDFTGGEATRLIEELKRDGAVTISEKAGLFRALKEL